MTSPHGHLNAPQPPSRDAVGGDAPGWVPDPDSDSRAVVEGFFDRLDRDLAAHGVTTAARRDLVADIRARQQRLQSSTPDLPDAAAGYNLRYTTAVLAAHQAINDTSAADTGADLPTGTDLIRWLTEAFVEPMAAPVAEATRTMLDTAADPFAAMVAIARTREDHDFGTQFRFEHPVDDHDRFFADVHRCGYHDFLSAHDAAQLTPVLCAFDANWITAIDPDRHGFTFTRDTTIGRGGTTCPFHFQRTPRRSDADDEQHPGDRGAGGSGSA